ncbi:hypothetical protein G3M48_009191 [Beauveria asiatica]|uniref:Uncharacterized protein n=1 Tax=Beauveria asiatica TaxID=1069075 RepID=A0AAW0S3R5_9HYPO
MGKRFAPLITWRLNISRPFVELLFSTPYMAKSLVLVPLKSTFASFNPQEQLLATAPTMNLVCADVGSPRSIMRGPMSGSSGSSAGVVVMAGVNVLVRYPGHFQFLMKIAPSFDVFVDLETSRLQGLHPRAKRNHGRPFT